ncbi:hypothetical protein CKO31_23875 [Thiohalocapsa halophila]|uniref:DUF805 domain-containing protein n=1 Tax=Thiohalocapsa halophila TaxID=69359 RepID=A0ABS1CPF2_9GAMM|nr:hypothetical protein [Thiohalocapsa halophila]MBK1633725.1 hypothetical protein [Thiohalocapsa halophila]
MPIFHAVVIVAIYLAAAMLVAVLGRRRKWGYWGYLWSSILFTPLLGFLFVLAADPPPKQQRGKEQAR